ncbi:DNA-binding protein [Klebsiella michiganensis]|uniref:AlpA family phage regulatory protein n=2 Tax=Klebsiella TaxID=570 RepID=A0ABT6EK17_9ENTR|nr:AlpA family phage regulatory protein [Klebsiella huaxiensis]MDG1645671.1 AlpA family phage regulatory protein [Klebsiella huaxiensis]PLL38793.1 DNA-binding protein [Klebsiella michiganensis]
MNQFRQTSPDIRVIREKECRKLTGICRTTRYIMERNGKFPARRQLGGRSVGWVLAEVLEWVNNQPKVALGRNSRKLEI